MRCGRKCTGPMFFLLILLSLYPMLLWKTEVCTIPGVPHTAAHSPGDQVHPESGKSDQHAHVNLHPSHTQATQQLQSGSERKTLPNISSVSTLPKRGVFILKPFYPGRLGNYMFGYASVYAMAVSRNMSLYVNDSNPLRRIFKLDPEVITNRTCSKWKRVSAPSCDYDPTLEQRIEPDKCQIVGDFLQSWKYFEKYSQDIHRSFRFQPDIEQSAKTKITKIIQTYWKKLENVTWSNNSQNVTLVGIHARQGDYNSRGSVRYGRITPPAGYYIRAMEYFRKKVPNPVFLAASDSISWLNENLKRKDVIILGGKKPEVDLSVLSMCNHTIMSVGTFGWWAGYLSGGITIYYKSGMDSNTPFGKTFKHYETDFIRKDWIGLE